MSARTESLGLPGGLSLAIETPKSIRSIGLC